MSSDWINKAKEEAKKLAEAAKNANYGEMFDKTKNMAKQAAEEAKKAASGVLGKDKNQATPTNPEEAPPSVTDDTLQPTATAQPTTTAQDPSVILERAAETTETDTATSKNPLIIAKVEQVEKLLQEIKQLLQPSK